MKKEEANLDIHKNTRIFKVRTLLLDYFILETTFK